MVFRALDALGDWTFGKGKNNYLSGLDSLKANIKTRTKEWKGECFFALQDGIDWNNYLDIGTKNLLDADLQRCWLQSFGVIRVDNYQSELNSITRQLTVTASLFTIYGTMLLSEVF